MTKTIEEQVWDKLRFDMLLRELKELAKKLNIDISDVSDNPHQKKEIARRVYDFYQSGG